MSGPASTSRNRPRSNGSGPPSTATRRDATLQKIVTSLRRKGYTVDTHDTVATTPRGYPADHPRIDLLRMKDIFAGKTFPPQPWLSTPKALDRIRRVMTEIKPLGDWLRQHVGSRRVRSPNADSRRRPQAGNPSVADSRG